MQTRIPKFTFLEIKYQSIVSRHREKSIPDFHWKHRINGIKKAKNKNTNDDEEDEKPSMGTT